MIRPQCRIFPLFLTLLLSPAAMSAAELEPDETRVYRSVDGLDLQLHVFNPPGHQATNRVPALVFFHGGGWQGGTPAQFFPQCRHLADQGMVTFSVQYRLTNQAGVEPKDCLADAKAAIRWVRQQAERLGVDPGRIAAGGGSAGGHLAAACANSLGFEHPGQDLSISSRPNALVLFNPVIDNGPGGYGHERVTAYWQAFSPLHTLRPDSPPTLIQSGTEDRIIPPPALLAYRDHMRAEGLRCELILYENQSHGFFNPPSPSFAPTTAAMDEFLRSLGYLQQP